MQENLLVLIFRNAISNYILMGSRLVVAVVQTRIMFLGLQEVGYGFWALIWSIFGYSLLLDFGFGTSISKYTAEVQVNQNYDDYNRKLSTIFGTYLVMSLFIVILIFVLQMNLEKIFQFPAGSDIDYYRKVLMFMGIGVALTFPTGGIPEILTGMKRIEQRNIVLFVNMILNLVGIILIFKLGMGLLAVAIFTVVLNLLTNAVMAVIILVLMPQIRISLRLFNFKVVKEVTNFSLFAYIIIFSNLIIYKTDTIILGIMINMSAVAIYQIGSRLSDMLNRLTTQFQETLAPVAASLFQSGDTEKLSKILLQSNRMAAFSSTILFLIFFILSPQILFVWLEVKDQNAIMLSYLLTISIFSGVLFRSVSTRILLMTGKHKFLAMTGLIEGAASITLSILFIKLMGIVGVGVGTMIPNLLVSLLLIMPAASRYIKLHPLVYLRKIYLPLVLISILPAAILIAAAYYIPVDSWKVWHILGSASLAGILYLAGGILFYLNPDDREKLGRLMPFLKGKKR